MDRKQGYSPQRPTQEQLLESPLLEREPTELCCFNAQLQHFHVITPVGKCISIGAGHM